MPVTPDLKNIQSPFRSGIEIEDYQLDPVVRAIQIPRVNLLIADDVGLGKTIEAGMVALELIIRHRARKMLTVVPPSLQIQWRDPMRDKFGLEFRIVDSELMRELRRRRVSWRTHANFTGRDSDHASLETQLQFVPKALRADDGVCERPPVLKLQDVDTPCWEPHASCFVLGTADRRDPWPGAAYHAPMELATEQPTATYSLIPLNLRSYRRAFIRRLSCIQRD